VLTVPKHQIVIGHGGYVELAAQPFLRLVNETEGGGVRIVGFIKVDGVTGDGDEGIFGEVGSIREGEGFTDDVGTGIVHAVGHG